MKFKTFFRQFALAFGSIAILALGLTSCGDSDEIRYIPVTQALTGNWGMVDLSNGKVIFSDEFKEQPTIVSENIFAVKEGEHISLYEMGKKPKPIDTPDLMGAGLCQDGLIPVAVKKERLQVLDKQGKKQFEIAPIGGIEARFCNCCYTDGMLRVTLIDGTSTYIDKKGKPIGRVFVTAHPFYNGYAIVQNKPDKKGGEALYEIIDNKGKTVFKCKSGWEVCSVEVENGKFLIKNANDTYCVVNLKGEVTKLPSSINMVSGYLEYGLIVFEREGEWGVMNDKGETKIRPKYTSIEIVDKNLVIAHKSSGVWVLLDGKGEELFSTDEYELMYTLGSRILGFGKNTVNILDYKGKMVSQEDFFGVSQLYEVGNLISDYYNPAETSEKISKLMESIQTQYKFGKKSAELLSKRSDFKMYSTYCVFEEPLLYGHPWLVQGVLYFSQDIGDYDSEFEKITFNDNAFLESIRLPVSMDGIKSQDLMHTLTKELEQKGYKVVVTEDGYVNENQMSLTKGDNEVILNCDISERLDIVIKPKNGLDIPAETLEMVEFGSDNANGGGSDGADSYASGSQGYSGSAQSGSGSQAAAGSAKNSSNNYGWLSERSVTESDLAGLSKAQCRILRNAIFARHGYKFKSKDLADYFGQFSWYNPQYSDVTSKLSKLEQQNIAFIKSHE